MHNARAPWNPLPLPQEGLLGLLLAIAECGHLPARPWPLAAACETLANDPTPIDHSFRETARSVLRFGGSELIEAWIQALARAGVVEPRGRGVTANWVVNANWMQGWNVVADGIPPIERAAWERAAQTLVNCVSIWAKTAAAAVKGSSPAASETTGIFRQPLE